MSAALPRIALTPGEPAGVGPELVAALAATDLQADLVAIADAGLLRRAAQQRGVEMQLEAFDGSPRDRRAPGVLRCVDIALAVPVVAGKLDAGNARYVLDTLARGADGCAAAEFDALVTGPVQKSIIADAGFAFTGHTEFFAQRARCDVVMMLAAPNPDQGGGRFGGDLRVALATTHLPLSAVPAAITQAGLVRTLRILCDDLIGRFGIAAPRVAVLGLNPHAGEGGHLGREEIDTIIPAIEQLRAAGFDLVGPLPADTAFLPSQLARFDAVLAMYHDQGLPVLKHAGFGHAVNVTLGLPYIRTSVDHGTALDLAGTGKADASSLEAAARLALKLVAHRAA
ncbi:MAG TPA: 4-hydroxythreonine-4-phosphate dehydrogenase PdxA [Rudaea sp.]|jgi:4-hydroxythreonine-4-phosphate dehydrogenase|nr:4-hydroxythreonine-4-phosphate dehydrogenase PdxA [Rudaea sp.]